MQIRFRFALLVLAFASFAGGCGDSGGSDSGVDSGPADGGTDSGPAPDGGHDAGIADDPSCEGLNPENCMLPWPSTHYLVDDTSTATGRHISVPMAAMPQNRDGNAIDPA